MAAYTRGWFQKFIIVYICCSTLSIVIDSLWVVRLKNTSYVGFSMMRFRLALDVTGGQLDALLLRTYPSDITCGLLALSWS